MTNSADTTTAASLPPLGLGTWQNTDHDRCVESVHKALDLGYRHVDTAQAYGNERAVGEGIAAADVDRSAVFLATKVWTSELGYDDVISSTEASLDRLDTDYVDLLYVHWPAGEYEPTETLPAFDALRVEGQIRHVGVSNFEPDHVERAREVLDAPVFANQVELHPHLQRPELRSFAAETDLRLVAYSPLARGGVFEDPVLSAIAEERDVSPAQVSLAWLRAKGVAAIPKATGEAHIRDNWASRDLDLDAAEIERIDAIDRHDRQVHPDWAPAAWERSESTTPP